MKYWKAIILGLVQGLTEFLPVSSSGHLMLLAELGIGEKALFFSIMLHVATLFSVCLFYRKRIYRLIRHPLQKENKYIIIATLPTVVFAIIVRLFFNEIGPSLLPFGFMISAVFLTLGSLNWGKGKKMDDISAFIVGVAQGIATIGGCSRSGSVVSTQLILGIDRETAGDFAFMLSIPIILASIAGECIAFKGYIGVETMPLILAMIVAFLSGLLAIKVFLQILKNGRLLPFAIYAFVLSIVSFYIIY